MRAHRAGREAKRPRDRARRPPAKGSRTRPRSRGAGGGRGGRGKRPRIRAGGARAPPRGSRVPRPVRRAARESSPCPPGRRRASKRPGRIAGAGGGKGRPRAGGAGGGTVRLPAGRRKARAGQAAGGRGGTPRPPPAPRRARSGGPRRACRTRTSGAGGRGTPAGRSRGSLRRAAGAGRSGRSRRAFPRSAAAYGARPAAPPMRMRRNRGQGRTEARAAVRARCVDGRICVGASGTGTDRRGCRLRRVARHAFNSRCIRACARCRLRRARAAVAERRGLFPAPDPPVERGQRAAEPPRRQPCQARDRGRAGGRVAGGRTASAPARCGTWRCGFAPTASSIPGARMGPGSPRAGLFRAAGGFEPARLPVLPTAARSCPGVRPPAARSSPARRGAARRGLACCPGQLHPDGEPPAAPIARPSSSVMLVISLHALDAFSSPSTYSRYAACALWMSSSYMTIRAE